MKTTAFPPFLTFIAMMLVLSYNGTAQSNANLKTYNSILNNSQWAFEENRGQLADPAGQKLEEIKFFGKKGGVQVYCKPTSLSFVFTKTNATTATAKRNPLEKFQPRQIMGFTATRIDMQFENGNPNAKIVAENKQDQVKNYFRNNGALTGINSYKKLTYINLYPNIDMVLLCKDMGMEYEFIVHPGGNVKDIKLVRKGMDKMEMLKNGGIRYSASFGHFDETKPYSYNASGEVKSSFSKIDGNKISFSTETYDKTKDLVIDPDLSWATFFGGSEREIGYSVATDASGNVYISGSTTSLSGIATNGASQVSLGGSAGREDAFLAKFTTAGTLAWATYFGGDSSETGFSVGVDSHGNVFMAGTTQSVSGIATTGAYQTSLGGTNISPDAFLAKFSSSGVLTWATYYGGAGLENCTGLAIDGSDNVYLSGYSFGSSSGVATSSSHQTSNKGSYDGILGKFSNSGSLIWGTYFGGTSTDAIFGVAVDAAKNVYISGLSVSTSGIATSGAFRTSVNANGNAFLAKLDSNGVQKWGTYYGNDGGDISYSVATNGSSAVFITGYTASMSGIATSGGYQTDMNAYTHTSFVADFSLNGVLQWGTYFGGEYQDEGLNITSDKSGNIYIAGYTVSSTGISTTNAYQKEMSNPSGLSGDGFMAKFSGSGSLLYATYYGGNNVDEVLAVTVDNADNIYLVGASNSDSGAVSAGAHQTTLAGDYDVLLAKLYLCDLTASVVGLNGVCINGYGYYKANDKANAAYSWTVNGGTIVSGVGTDSIVVKWTATNGGTLMLKEVLISGCRDSVVLPVTIYPLPTPSINGKLSVCVGDQASYQIKSVVGNNSAWTVTGGTAKSPLTLDSVKVQWPGTAGKGKIKVQETSLHGCVNKDSAEIIINALPNAKFAVADGGDGSYTFSAADSTNPAAGYTWKIQGSSPGIGYHVKNTYTHIGAYDVMLTVKNAAGCVAIKDTVLNIIHAGIDGTSGTPFGMNVYPNPFAGNAEINYTLPNVCRVLITITDMLGRNMATLEDNTMGAGKHTTSFNNKIAHIEPGTYFVNVTINGETSTQKIIKLRD